MTYVFCFADVLDAKRDSWIPIHSKCCLGEVDIFEVGAAFRILDLDSPHGGTILGGLLEKVPLYRINLELLLDGALAARHNNTSLAQALQKAYGTQPLPGTLPNVKDHTLNLTTGHLHHPMLAHMSAEDLARFYIDLAAVLPEYTFDRILHKNVEPFTVSFDGYKQGEGGFAALLPLLTDAYRVEVPMSAIQDPLEGYLECTLLQYLRARAVDFGMRLGLEKTPEWVRRDVHTLVHLEEQKIGFAQAIDAQMCDRLSPDLSTALARDKKQSHVSIFLQRLVGEVLSPHLGTPYSGAGAQLAQDLVHMVNMRMKYSHST